MQTGYNPARGDVQINLGGQNFVLRPSFLAIAKLEAHFGKGILDIARDYHNGAVTRAADFLAILEAGIEGAGQGLSENLGDIMLAHGLAQLLAPLGQFLAHACGIRNE